ncbi:isoquinoline 1-oxidoreductase, beta subunit [Pustulibacterium marinum]|uniref:Isoquinoline 1-oxidoreductase, beta subunit n=1 Tax=Pustulibacterium marinum TaxID=1224947 RepID=A0A1I7GFC3_9FLAO|nr:molybdopterin cofactor-binding domain-containing protein [Pustulibacterium marinum]SFU47172.1 isoquinoline 1-oxidoreductase, beta subunit [Pustulibacterium marinum]
MFDKAIQNPVGENNQYDAKRYKGVLQLVKEKAKWQGLSDKRGVAAYFCHNTYVAHVVEANHLSETPIAQHVTTAVDCGVVVNKDAAKNMVEGAVIDGIGNAIYGEMTFTDGKPDKENFHSYKMIRMPESPTSIEVHFVENEEKPTGLGEPPFPPVFAALANALYKKEHKRFYHQPFTKK